jgi:hypothetical protein
MRGKVVVFLGGVMLFSTPPAMAATTCSDCEHRCTGAPAFLRKGCAEACSMFCRILSATSPPGWDQARETVATIGGRPIAFAASPFPSAEGLWRGVKSLAIPLVARWKTSDRRADLRRRLLEYGIEVKQQEHSTSLANALASAFEYALVPYLLAQPKVARQVLRKRDPRGLRISRKHLAYLALHGLFLCSGESGPKLSPLLQAAGWLQKEGTFEERHWPFAAWDPTSKQYRSCLEAAVDGTPSQAAEASRHFLVDQFFYLPGGSRRNRASARRPGDIRAIVARGYPVVLSVFAFGGRGWKSALVETPPEATSGDVHTVLIVGFDHPKKQLLFVNSWGPGWGDHGFGYLPYRYVEKFALEGMFVRSVRIVGQEPEAPEPSHPNETAPAPKEAASPPAAP